MAILRNRKLSNGWKMQLVSGTHIYETYQSDNIDSCMSGESSAIFYTFVKDLALLRIIDDTKNKKNPDILLRALIWTVEDEKGNKIKYIDVVYQDNHAIDHDCQCRYCKDIIFPYKYFVKEWPKYADQRGSKKKLFARVRPGFLETKEYKSSSGPGVHGLPYFDTFSHLYKDKKGEFLISNSSQLKFEKFDHGYDTSNRYGYTYNRW